MSRKRRGTPTLQAGTETFCAFGNRWRTFEGYGPSPTYGPARIHQTTIATMVTMTTARAGCRLIHRTIDSVPLFPQALSTISQDLADHPRQESRDPITMLIG